MVSQLSANHTCIRISPQIIANSAPTSTAADFHTSFHLITPIHQSDVTICTYYTCTLQNTYYDEISVSILLQLTRSFSYKWLAYHTSVFEVDAVMATNRIGKTVSQSGFSSSALDVVQPDGSSSLTKGWQEECSSSWGFTQECTNTLILLANTLLYLCHGILAAYIQQWHRPHPKSHRTLFPTVHCYKTPRVLRSWKHLPPISNLLDCRLNYENMSCSNSIVNLSIHNDISLWMWTINPYLSDLAINTFLRRFFFSLSLNFISILSDPFCYMLYGWSMETGYRSLLDAWPQWFSYWSGLYHWRPRLGIHSMFLGNLLDGDCTKMVAHSSTLARFPTSCQKSPSLSCSYTHCI